MLTDIEVLSFARDQLFRGEFQTSSYFYQSGNHGLLKSFHQAINHVAVTRFRSRCPTRGGIFVAEFLRIPKV